MKAPIIAIIMFCVFMQDVMAQIYVSTDGNDANPGTVDSPFATIHHAVEVVEPGQTIWVKGGTYVISERIKIPDKATSATKMIRLWALPGTGEVVIDGSAMHHTNQADFKMGRCIYVNHLANYWHFRGLTLCNAEDNGMKVEGSYNIIENCVFHDNNDTGLQIGMYKDFSIEETKSLPAGEPKYNPDYRYCRGNKVINCDSYNNADSRSYNGSDDYGDADGFACKLFPGPGTEFHGCRAWDNSDDNWDLYMVYHPVVIDGCWAYHAGYKPGTNTAVGNGNGFKLGGGGSSGGAAFDQSTGAHVVTNCVAFDNLHKGFDQNNAYEGMYIINCVSWGNEYNYRFPTLFKYGGMYIRNSVGFNATKLNHEFLSADKTGSVLPNTDFNSWTLIDGCDPYKDGNKVNGTNVKAKDYSSQFRSLKVEDFKAERQADGSLPDNDFARLADGSIFIDKGEVIEGFTPTRFMTEAEASNAGIELVTAAPISIIYNDVAPDLGAFEAGKVTKASLTLISGTASQLVSRNTPIENVTYKWGGAATDVELTATGNLTATKDIDAKTVTISGSPTEDTQITISTIGGENTVSAIVNITVTDKTEATLVCKTENMNQSVIAGDSINDIIIEYGGGATAFEVSCLPQGLSYTINKKILTITGVPMTSGSFTVSALGGIRTVSLSGSIKREAAHSDEQGKLSWTFDGVPSADIENITNDALWNSVTKSSVLRYQYKGSCDNSPLTANGKELGLTRGLLFTILDGTTNSDGRNLYLSTAGMWLGDKSVITLPQCKAGQWVKIEYSTSKDKTERTLTTTNLTTSLPSSSASKTHVAGKSEIMEDGDVTFKITGGMYIYSIILADSEAGLGGGSGSTGGGGDSPENPDNPQETIHVFDIKQDFALLSEKYIYKGEDAVSIYVSPEGNDENDGLSKETPIKSLQLAFDRAIDPGTTIYLAPGEYRPTDRLNINDRNGLHDKYNALVCLDGRAVINCDHPTHGHSDNPYQGIRLTSSYWYFYHVDVTNASDNGLLIERNKPTGGSSADIVAAVGQAHDNIINACNFYKNGDTGLQMKNLAAYNYVINCDSYLNCDEDQGDADGFAPKISVGTGNYFFGCRAYLNSDDGWDVFYKKDGNFGDNMTIILDNCITYKNGFLDENTIASKGNGNGFKCGSDQGAMNVYLTRCLAIQNKAKGFDQNHNSGDIILNNCTGYINTSEPCFNGYADKAYSYRIYESISDGHKVEVNNSIAINDNDEKDKRDSSGTPKPSEHGKNGIYGRFQIEQDDTSAGELIMNNNEFQLARPEFFKSLDHSQLIAPRVNDQLSLIDFAHIDAEAKTSYTYTANKKSVDVEITAREILIDKGITIDNNKYEVSNGDVFPVLPVVYYGSAPDLGAYELTSCCNGDVNGDGAVSVADLTMIASCILGDTPIGFNKDAADVNGDGIISVSDLTLIASEILKQFVE